MEPIRRGIEGFLRGRYGYEGYRAFRVLAVPVLIGAILVVGWLLVEPLLTIPRISSTGPVVRNGVAVVVVCGDKQRGVDKGLMAAGKYAPEPRTGTWASERRGNCTVWYHHPPGMEQRTARQERAQREQTSVDRDDVVRACGREVLAEYRHLPEYRDLATDFARECG